MTPLSAPLPAADTDRHPGLDPLENPWLILWRTLWFDVPILWANEIDRLLDREAGPLTDAAPLPDGRRENGGETGLGMVDASVTPEVAVALGLGCGAYSEAILGVIGQS